MMLSRNVMPLQLAFVLFLFGLGCLPVRAQEKGDYIITRYQDTIYGKVIDQSWDTAFSQIGFQDTFGNDTLQFSPLDLEGFKWAGRHFSRSPYEDGREVFLEALELGCMSLWQHPVSQAFYLRKGTHSAHLIQEETYQQQLISYTRENRKVSRKVRSGRLPYDSLHQVVQHYNQWMVTRSYRCDFTEPFGFVKWWKDAAPYVQVGFGTSWFETAPFREQFHGGISGSLAAGFSPFGNRVFTSVITNVERYTTYNHIGSQSILLDWGLGINLAYRFTLKQERYVRLFGGFGLSTYTLTAQGCDCDDGNFELASGSTSGLVAGLEFQKKRFFLSAGYHLKQANVTWNATSLVAAGEKGYDTNQPQGSIPFNRLSLTLGMHLSGKKLINLKY